MKTSAEMFSTSN